MRKTNFTVLAMVAVSLLVALAWAKKQENVEEQIKALHEQGRQAALKGDVGFLRKYLAVD